MATVIMILTLMALIRYFYDFSDINLPSVNQISELNYIPFIKEALNDTVVSFNDDCDKLQEDLSFTKDFLELCDGKNSLEAICKNLFSRHGNEEAKEDFFWEIFYRLLESGLTKHLH